MLEPSEARIDETQRVSSAGMDAAGSLHLALWLSGFVGLTCTVVLHARRSPWKAVATEGELLVLLSLVSLLVALLADVLTMTGALSVGGGPPAASPRVSDPALCAVQSIVRVWSVLAAQGFALASVWNLLQRLSSTAAHRRARNWGQYVSPCAGALVLSVSVHVASDVAPTDAGAGVHCSLTAPIPQLLLVSLPELLAIAASIEVSRRCLRSMWAASSVQSDGSSSAGSTLASPTLFTRMAGAAAGTADQADAAPPTSTPGSAVVSPNGVATGRITQNQSTSVYNVIRRVRNRLLLFFGSLLLLFASRLQQPLLQLVADGSDSAVGPLWEGLGLAFIAILMFFVWGVPKLHADGCPVSCCGSTAKVGVDVVEDEECGEDVTPVTPAMDLGTSEEGSSDDIVVPLQQLQSKRALSRRLNGSTAFERHVSAFSLHSAE